MVQNFKIDFRTLANPVRSVFFNLYDSNCHKLILVITRQIYADGGIRDISTVGRSANIQ